MVTQFGHDEQDDLHSLSLMVTTTIIRLLSACHANSDTVRALFRRYEPGPCRFLVTPGADWMKTFCRRVVSELVRVGLGQSLCREMFEEPLGQQILVVDRRRKEGCCIHIRKEVINDK